MRGSEGMNPGAAGSEPAAMIALSNRTICAPSPVSTRKVFGEVNLPSPVTTRHLALFRKPGQAARQAFDDAGLPVADGDEL